MRLITHKPVPIANANFTNSIKLTTEEFSANAILKPSRMASSIGSSITNLTKNATAIPTTQIKSGFMMVLFYHKQLRFSRT